MRTRQTDRLSPRLHQGDDRHYCSRASLLTLTSDISILLSDAHWPRWLLRFGRVAAFQMRGEQRRGLFRYERARRTLTCLSVAWHLVAKATASAVVDWFIDLTFFARRHELTLLWLLEKT